MVRLTGACLGLLAFGLATFAGLLAGNSLIVILSRALCAMVIFLLIGLLVGWVGMRIVEEYAQGREQALRAQAEAAQMGEGGEPDADAGADRQETAG